MVGASTSETGLVARRSQYWGWVLANGILGIVVGLFALFNPGITILTAGFLLGIGLVVQGGIELWVAVRSGTGTAGRVWLVVFGVIALLAGFLVLANPGSGIVALTYGVVLWFVIAGVNDFIVAFSTSGHRGWNIVLGVLSLLVALILLFSPGTALGAIALVIGLAFLVRGGADIGLSLSMRRATR